MGSSFISAVCEATPLSLEEFEEAARALLRTRPIQTLNMEYNELFQNEEIPPAEEQSADEVINKLVERAQEALKLIRENLSSRKPRVAEFLLDGKYYWFTGIDTWGDSSGELDAIALLGTLGVDSLGVVPTTYESALQRMQQLRAQHIVNYTELRHTLEREFLNEMPEAETERGREFLSMFREVAQEEGRSLAIADLIAKMVGR